MLLSKVEERKSSGRSEMTECLAAESAEETPQTDLTDRSTLFTPPNGHLENPQDCWQHFNQPSRYTPIHQRSEAASPVSMARHHAN